MVLTACSSVWLIEDSRAAEARRGRSLGETGTSVIWFPLLFSSSFLFSVAASDRQLLHSTVTGVGQGHRRRRRMCGFSFLSPV